jgi:hypothetical protein
MVNLVREKPLTLREVAALLPFSYTTLHRWSKVGHHGIRLETCKFPGKLLTSLEAVQRFTEQLEALESAAPPVQPDRHQEIRRALREEHGL